MHSVLRRLTTPQRIQDFLDTLPINFEPSGDTCMSPQRVLETGVAHCIEGALLAVHALELHGQEAWLMDLRAIEPDFDHVVAVFKQRGRYGAISKTNHAVLRYREPVYHTPRELAYSFFHEYFTDDGKKTLREYSDLISLQRFAKRNWPTSDEDLWYIAEYVDLARHYPFLLARQKLRTASPLEIAAGKLTEWKPNGKRNIV